MHIVNIIVDALAVGFIVGGLCFAGFTALMNYRVPPKTQKGRERW